MDDATIIDSASRVHCVEIPTMRESVEAVRARASLFAPPVI